MTSFQLLLIRCCRAACRCRSPQSCWAVKLCTTTPNVLAVPAPQAFLVKLYTTDGGAKLLRRKWVPSAAELLLPPAACNCVVAGNVLGPNLSPHANWPASPSADVQCCHAAARTRRSGEVERQIRYNVGKLPVAYRTEPDGRWVLVLLLFAAALLLLLSRRVLVCAPGGCRWLRRPPCMACCAAHSAALGLICG